MRTQTDATDRSTRPTAAGRASTCSVRVGKFYMRDIHQSWGFLTAVRLLVLAR
jgi:hypothetical protein